MRRNPKPSGLSASGVEVVGHDLAVMIACVEAELERRLRAYPGLIASADMTAAAAADEIECMTAVLVTLQTASPRITWVEARLPAAGRLQAEQ